MCQKTGTMKKLTEGSVSASPFVCKVYSTYWQSRNSPLCPPPRPRPKGASFPTHLGWEGEGAVAPAQHLKPSPLFLPENSAPEGQQGPPSQSSASQAPPAPFHPPGAAEEP